MSTSLVSRRYSTVPGQFPDGPLDGNFPIEIIPTTPDRLSATVVGLIAERGWDRVASVRTDRVGHPSVLGVEAAGADLDGLDAVITEGAAFIEPLMTVVLDHSEGQGHPGLTGRAAIHVCVIRHGQVVSKPEEVALLVTTAESTWVGPKVSGLVEADEEGPGPEGLVVVIVQS